VADPASRVRENVPGAFYVDETCIDCELCREKAPANFTRQDDRGYSYVYRQPRDEAERAACQEALEECPVEAIGRDGQAPA
jgi:ferredoxin